LTGPGIQDVVLLNKVDLVTGGSAEVEDLEAQIHRINGLVKIVRSERCQVDLKDVFERRAYKAQVQSSLPRWICCCPNNPYLVCFVQVLKLLIEYLILLL